MKLKALKQKSKVQSPKSKASPPQVGDHYLWHTDYRVRVMRVMGALTVIGGTNGILTVPTAELMQHEKVNDRVTHWHEPTGPLQTCGDLCKRKRIAKSQEPIANPDRTVAQMVVVPASKIKPGQKLVVALMGPEDAAAVHAFLLHAPEVAIPLWASKKLVPLMQSLARNYLIG